MSSSPEYDEVSLISKGLYRIVSDIVGPECIVKQRRQGMDIYNDLSNCDSSKKLTSVMSGSKGEGFEFKSSDYDVMHIDRNAIVLTSSTLFIAPYYNIPTILLMETENISPGFAFIKCLRCDQSNATVRNALVLRENDVYVSSKQIRETFMSTNMSRCHGPCQTIDYLNNEGDNAFTLRCPIWPKEALSFIGRSLNQGWPTYETLTDICKEGCLFVPINNKHEQYSVIADLQWRISFSLAEKKLIYSMNHCQFLCYGLSKIFLNEVLKKSSDEDLLCSYFMKTAIFWEISDNHSDWSPFNFLSKFWNVFRRLIKWVSIGYCPNFFKPENNMFYGKICGEKQITLLCTLRELYMDGYWSLLRCPSLNENLSKLVTQPGVAFHISIEELEYVPLQVIERERLIAILNFKTDSNVTNIRNIIEMLINMLMIKTGSTEFECAVRLGINHVLQKLAQFLFTAQNARYPIISWNRLKYNRYKAAKSILWRTQTYFCMNYFIFIKQMYMTENYRRAVEMIHYTRHKLQSQPYMYEWTLDGDTMMTALQQGMSYDTVVKTLIVSNVRMNLFTTVEELIPECLALAETIGGSGLLYIPPLVFLDFLLILCYTRLRENHRRYDVLDELHTLLYNDDGHYILYPFKAMSWEILGVCQQLCGDRHGAYVSYVHALDDDYNYFKQATLERINSLGNI